MKTWRWMEFCQLEKANCSPAKSVQLGNQIWNKSRAIMARLQLHSPPAINEREMFLKSTKYPIYLEYYLEDYYRAMPPPIQEPWKLWVRLWSLFDQFPIAFRSFFSHFSVIFQSFFSHFSVIIGSVWRIFTWFLVTFWSVLSGQLMINLWGILRSFLASFWSKIGHF